MEIFNRKSKNILLPLNLEKGYDYLLPIHISDLQEGSLVQVPLRNKKEFGIVLSAAVDNLPEKKMKEVERVFDKLPTFSKQFLDFISWVSNYTVSKIGNVFKMSIPVKEVFEEAKQERFYGFAKSGIPQGFRMTNSRRSVIDLFETEGEGLYYTISELSQKTGASTQVVKEMEKAGCFDIKFEDIKPEIQNISYDKEFTLNESQDSAVKFICEEAKNGFSPILLDGVTGSGKTEVYFKVIDEILSKNSENQTLIMLPEISLTGQFLKKFNKRFGCKPVLWHSSLTPSQRKKNWLAIAGGEAKVVVGTRSALFLPFHKLSLIIVDEEHDGSFKQEENVVYHGRDMAVVRAKFESIPIVLASATPSLETIANVQTGKFKEVKLHSRFGKAIMPDISLCDLRSDKPIKEEWGNSYLSPSSIKKIEDKLRRNEQIMLFLNRRGYAPLAICKDCGHKEKCPNCDVHLTAHGKENPMLKCHHCGYFSRIRNVCSECEAKDSFTLYGIGIERLAEEVANRYPTKKVAILSSDTLNTTKKLYETIEEIEKGNIDIIIGTQIFAKGHHFPNLTLVIVVDGDMGLTGADIRAGEKTFALLSQVSGRAGRGEKSGEVVIQTFQPENKVMQALLKNDREEFLNLEVSERKLLSMPPFGRLAAVILTSKDQGALDVFANQLAREIPRSSDSKYMILGPVDAPIAFIKGNHRKRFLIKTEKRLNIQQLIINWTSSLKIPNSIKLKIDIDPHNFM
ncbi:MAG: primosomal protein N' [Alphaproteobacteria bacterium]|nr:primosomal protein N' [Alphaproteobacteria bacterium]